MIAARVLARGVWVAPAAVALSGAVRLPASNWTDSRDPAVRRPRERDPAAAGRFTARSAAHPTGQR